MASHETRNTGDENSSQSNLFSLSSFHNYIHGGTPNATIYVVSWSIFTSVKSIALITPTHKSILDELELRRISISIALNSQLPHYFVVPKTLDCASLESQFPNSKFLFLDSEYFRSVQSYNQLLLRQEFYLLFKDYMNILILQTDAFLRKDITPIQSLGYDYIGAPWHRPFRVSIHKNEFHPDNRRHALKSRVKVQVGNGGLSIRNVDSMMKVINFAGTMPYAANVLSGVHNEDLILSYLSKICKLNVPDVKTSAGIFTENYWHPQIQIDSIYGFHALGKYQPDLEHRLMDTAYTK